MHSHFIRILARFLSTRFGCLDALLQIQRRIFQQQQHQHRHHHPPRDRDVISLVFSVCCFFRIHVLSNPVGFSACFALKIGYSGCERISSLLTVQIEKQQQEKSREWLR